MGVLLSQLEPLCANHPNKSIQVALNFIRAICATDDSINRHKTLTHIAVTAAQQHNNRHLMAMCLCYMSNRFFADTVGPQTLKSVNAARSVSKQSKSIIWIAVAYGLCISTMQRIGQFQEAVECQQALTEVWNKLPPTLQANMQSGGQGFVTDEGSDVQMG